MLHARAAASARSVRFFAILAVALLAGCANAPAPAAEDAEALRIVAIDGRWSFDPERAAALLARAGAPAPVGQLVLVEARGAARALEVVGLDADAARALGIDAPAPGEALALRGVADEGASLALAADAYPIPYVATYFEMERTPPCARRADAKLCFLPELEEGTARLRLIVDEGARDAGFLPDLVELGPTARPAYWNGTFEGPNGEVEPFTAYALAEGDLVPAEFSGAMSAGDWIVSFRLEANGSLVASGAAGIVRVREPGYLWFDDRLQLVTDAVDQARAVLENATPTRAEVRVARVADALPLGADVILALDDARALAGAPGVTALLANMTADQMRALDTGRAREALALALRARPLPAPLAPAPERGALLFAAPHDINVSALPPVEGAGAPALALAARPPVGEPPRMDGEPIGAGLLLLAHADGPVPWGVPPGGRWTRADEALENLSRSRTLALGSPDLVSTATATARVDVGQGNTSRATIAIGGVTGGPERVLWTSAALVAGSAKPVSARVVLPLEPGADRDDVARRALAAWGDAGVVLDR